MDAMCKASGRKNRETRAVVRTTGVVIAFSAQDKIVGLTQGTLEGSHENPFVE
mgnify:FL=1